MAWFNDLFSRNQDNKYIATDDEITEKAMNKEKETIEKNIRAGKASVRDDLAIGLDVSNSKSDLDVDKSRVLQVKRVLYRYSQNILVQAIIRTRTNQVRKYSRPSRYSTENIGFEVVPKEARGKNHKPSQEQLKQARKIEEFLQNTGSQWSPQRKDFASFISQFIYNHYVYDQINVERVFKTARSNVLDHFNIVDAKTVVLDNLPRSVDEPRKFLQYTNEAGAVLGHPVHFNEKELTFVVYNNQTDLNRHGYGFSEVEASLNHLKYHTDTEQFNARFFAQGGTTRGILVIDGGDNAGSAQNAASLSALRRQWQASFSGVNGAWKIPVVSAQDAKYVNMTQSSKDME